MPVQYSAGLAPEEAGVAAQAGLGQDVVGDQAEPDPVPEYGSLTSQKYRTYQIQL